MTNTLYLTLTRKETIALGIIAPIYIALYFLIGAMHFWLLSILSLIATVFMVIALKDYIKDTLLNLSLLGHQVWLKPLLAVALNLVICTVFNDLLLLYEVPFFVASGWGPVLWDIRASVLSAQPLFWLIAIVVVLVMPVAEELIFRQLIFTIVHPVSNGLAILVSVLTFAGFHGLLFAGFAPNTVYAWVYTFQFVPMGLFLCWLYKSTDSIAAPIFMHALRNLLLVFTAVRYMSMM